MLPTFDFSGPRLTEPFSLPYKHWARKCFFSLSQASRKRLPNAKLFYTSTNKKGPIQKIFERLSLLFLCQKMQHVENKQLLNFGQCCCSPFCVLEQGSDQTLHFSCGEFSCKRPLPICPPVWERNIFNQTAKKCHVKTSLLSTCYSSKSEGKTNPVSSLLAVCNLSPELFS